MGYNFVSGVARQLGARPRDISRLFYERLLDDATCPIVAGRRLIPDSYVPVIAAALCSRGLLTDAAASDPSEAALQA